MNKYIILGHENPDVDSIISGYLLSKLMSQLGYEVEFIIPDAKIPKESLAICEEYGLNPTNYQKKSLDYKNCKFILVDHHSRNIQGEIIGIIDHHPTLLEINIPYYRNEFASSTSCMICKEFENYFTKDDIELALVATMIDTASFHSTKTKESDIAWTQEMCDKYQINYSKIYRTGLSLTDISDPNIACYNGLKKYDFYGYNVESSYIQVEDRFKIIDLIDKMINILKDHVVNSNLEIFVFIVHDMTRFQTVVYEIKKDGYDTCKYEEYTSRGDTIIPEIEEKLKNKSIKEPKEK